MTEALHPYREGLVIATKGGGVRTRDSAWHIAGRPEQLRAMCRSPSDASAVGRFGDERRGLVEVEEPALTGQPPQ